MFAGVSYGYNDQRYYFDRSIRPKLFNGRPPANQNQANRYPSSYFISRDQSSPSASDTATTNTSSSNPSYSPTPYYYELECTEKNLGRTNNNNDGFRNIPEYSGVRNGGNSCSNSLYFMSNGVNFAMIFLNLTSSFCDFRKIFFKTILYFHAFFGVKLEPFAELCTLLLHWRLA